MFLFCLVFAMSLCASVYMCFVVTSWERADLLALVCGVYCEFVTFPLVSWVRCGTWLYRFLIFAPLLTFILSVCGIPSRRLKTSHYTFLRLTTYPLLFRNNIILIFLYFKGCPLDGFSDEELIYTPRRGIARKKQYQIQINITVS